MKLNEIVNINEYLDQCGLGHMKSATLYQRSYQRALNILNLKIWENPIYQKLLIPSIFNYNAKRIVDMISEFESLGIEKYINTSSFRKTPFEVRAIYHYLVRNHCNIVIGDRLNPMFSMAPSVLKEKYGIDIKPLAAVEEEIEYVFSK